MMKKMILTLSLLASVSASASNHGHSHKHKEHGAHVHGAGELSVAFESTKGKITYEGSAQGILGFEHVAKKEKDVKKLSEVTAQFENDFSKMVKLDPSLKCQFTKEKLGQVPEKGQKKISKHSDWVAEFSINCEKSPMNSDLVIDFTAFSGLKDVDVTIVVDSLQKSAEYKGQVLTVSLK